MNELTTLEARLSLIKDRVNGVAQKFGSGLYLWGRGGTSKTYTVENTLKASGNSYVMTNSRLTGAGLFDLLAKAPDSVHVLDDVETLFADKTSHGVLRAALGDRRITWQTRTQGRKECEFQGGIIMIANSALPNVPELQAMATRIPIMEYAPTDDEILSLMMHLAEGGFERGGRKLDSLAALEVVAEVVVQSTNRLRPLDIRLYVNACTDRLQYEAGASSNHWKDLLESRLSERVACKKKWESELAKSLMGLPVAVAVARWRAETGKEQASMYRARERALAG